MNSKLRGATRRYLRPFTATVGKWTSNYGTIRTEASEAQHNEMFTTARLADPCAPELNCDTLENNLGEGL